ncbi:MULTISPECIES: hypothetical protein [Burkholderia cepacia complex]|uniref:hypothetical protein n=1 Tax=Burkholderia cepacia complex TaxID=87882 RepID=UPI0011B1EEDD|nr:MULTISPECIES: hypothetical protein [Burkholderia cepacia complex]MBR7919690.1 hypothetical protein [Burkholderia vietnamiensis]MBR8205340.1 hypothetical protein [Burkholderia vietnamiensis]
MISANGFFHDLFIGRKNMLTQAFKAQGCRFASAFVAGSFAGGLSLDGLGLPAPVASAIGGTVAAAMFMSARVRAFWYGRFGVGRA